MRRSWLRAPSIAPSKTYRTPKAEAIVSVRARSLHSDTAAMSASLRPSARRSHHKRFDLRNSVKERCHESAEQPTARPGGSIRTTSEGRRSTRFVRVRAERLNSHLQRPMMAASCHPEFVRDRGVRSRWVFMGRGVSARYFQGPKRKPRVRRHGGVWRATQYFSTPAGVLVGAGWRLYGVFIRDLRGSASNRHVSNPHTQAPRENTVATYA